MSPKPMCPFSCVSGSWTFWPACIWGSAWGGGPPCDEDAPLLRAAPLTMWMVCDDWILYVESASSSCIRRRASGNAHKREGARETTHL